MNELFKELPELKPVPTGVEPVIHLNSSQVKLIKACVFDIYGTLLISVSGDIGTTSINEVNAVKALKAAGVLKNGQAHPPELGRRVIEAFLSAINNWHTSQKALGNKFPEVAIDRIWRTVLNQMVSEGLLTLGESFDIKYLSIAFEFLNNPTYPMPGSKSLLNHLSNKNKELGLISNAQFYTPLLLKYYYGGKQTLSDHQIPYFSENISIFSYKEGAAKPGDSMYEKMVKNLADQNIKPTEVLYFGNDMLHDIYPAKRAGFYTALFAGDKRSLRLREGFPQINGLVPDLTVTHWDQVRDLFNL
jgi:putative hydrolase of the HAD superfamily